MKESAKKSDRSWRYVGWHLVAMAAVCLLLFLGVKYGLNMYTHHGEAIPVPDVKNKPADEAKKALAALELIPVVTDTGYVKKLPPGCVLEQMPAAGSRVKSGHTVRLVLNAKSAPLLKLPDVIDNSSLRTAMSRLSAMGFKMGIGSEGRREACCHGRQDLDRCHDSGTGGQRHDQRRRFHHLRRPRD